MKITLVINKSVGAVIKPVAPQGKKLLITERQPQFEVTPSLHKNREHSMRQARTETPAALSKGAHAFFRGFDTEQSMDG